MLNIPPYPSPNHKLSTPASLSAMSSTTSSTYKQPPNNNVNDRGMGKMGEEPEANLYRGKEMVDQGPAEKNQDKGKEILIGEEPKASRDKRKAILVEEPEASQHSKNPKTAAEEGGDGSIHSSKESSPVRHFGFIINPVRGCRKFGYSCGFCDKSFISPQALGGHQNGHKWERSLKQGIQAINIAMGRRPYCYEAPSLAPHSYQPFIGNEGACLNPVTEHLHPYHQYAGLDGTFQYAGTASFNAGTMYDTMETGNNSTFPHPLRASAGFGTGYGTMEDGNNAFQLPELAWFNPGFVTLDIGNTSTSQHPLSESFCAGFGTSSGTLEIGNGAFQHPELAWFSPGFVTLDIGNTSTSQHPLSESFCAGFGTSSGTLEIGNGAFQHPELAWFSPEFGTNCGWVDNISGLYRQINEVKETQQSGTSGFDFVLLPTNDQIIGSQQVRRSEIDFGLLPKRNGEDRETRQDEASKIDLTLKL